VAIKDIIKYPNPILRKKARKVPFIDSGIQRLIDDMIVTMKAAPGSGLAAPQIGVSLQVIVCHPPEEEPFALINPEIVKKGPECEMYEGCLSVPGLTGDVMRAEAITVKGLNRSGKHVRMKAENVKAHILQHEIDHLHGVLFIDRAAAEKIYTPENDPHRCQVGEEQSPVQMGNGTVI
jgi:peptide deformylase